MIIYTSSRKINHEDIIRILCSFQINSKFQCWDFSLLLNDFKFSQQLAAWSQLALSKVVHLLLGHLTLQSVKEVGHYAG